MRCLVLGAGRIGAAIASDLSAESRFEVTVADRAESALAPFRSGSVVRCVSSSLDEISVVTDLASRYDLVVGALPSSLGRTALAAVIAAGRDYVDISFMAEDPLELDSEARRAGATVVVDCGLAPGLSSLFLGHLTRVLDRVESFICYVGGLPQKREPPWEYKAAFAPSDVLAEYMRPARFRVAGRQVTAPALSDLEEIEIEGLGRLEAFNTDGLRTLLRTVDVPDLREKTVRYPGHAERVGLLRDSGFLGTEPVSLGCTEVVPLALTSKLLFDLWRLGEGEADIAVMRVAVEGRVGHRRERHELDLLDRYDADSGTSAMARTTGYTCTAVVRLIAEERFRRPGVSAAEHVGMQDGCYRSVVADLESRGIGIHHRVSDLDG